MSKIMTVLSLVFLFLIFFPAMNLGAQIWRKGPPQEQWVMSHDR